MAQLPFYSVPANSSKQASHEKAFLYTQIGCITQVDNSEVNVILHIQVC